MTTPPRAPTTVEATVAELSDRLRTQGDRFHAIALPPDLDPAVLLRDPLASGVVAAYERPSGTLSLIATGEAGRAEAAAGEGPAAARAAASRLLEAPCEGATGELRPRLLGGFRFDRNAASDALWAAFGSGRLVLPRMLFVRDSERWGVVCAPGCEIAYIEELFARLDGPPAAPEHPAGLSVEHDVDQGRWRASVDNIAAEVRAGLYEKAVLATSVTLVGPSEIAVGQTLDRLRRGYPDCHLFAFAANEGVFLGASPELLVALSDGRVTALGLAGSQRRGESAEEDEQLGRALMESAKDRMEHEAVVRAIREGLGEVTEALRAPNQPVLRRLRNIQHLSTEITARARPGIDVLDLLERLHPTPAVCGWPKSEAMEVIRAHEDFDRGWYAGPIGWMDAAGDGEFVVALRSALVVGRRAHLFAGNGIMGDSHPDSELAEVRLKFRPLTEALGGSLA